MNNKWLIKFEKKSIRHGLFTYSNNFYFYKENKIIYDGFSNYSIYRYDYIIIDKNDFLFNNNGLIITKYSKSFKFIFNNYKKLKDLILPIIIFNSFLMTNQIYILLLFTILSSFFIYYILDNMIYYILNFKKIKHVQNIINSFNIQNKNNYIEKWLNEKIILLKNY